ncbi:MAG: K(+)-transporting ATPase subunit F [Bacteroidetes bacterium QH_8_67_23]|nr:MAG: K(+)-transporting ATPase subunit F [Bacteroidetes bacterium QH_8_67_23]
MLINALVILTTALCFMYLVYAMLQPEKF